jgi:transposase
METQINYRQLFEEQREQNKQLQLLIVQLQQQIEQLLRAQFGKKSERKPKVRVPKPNAVPSSVTFSHKDKTLTQGRALPGSFERVDIHHDVQEERKQCAHCNTRLHEIKAIERELWAYRPGSLYVKKHIRHRYACRSCQQTIVTAKMPIQPIEKGVADSSLLAQVIVDKYQDHLPLYRQEQRWLRNGAALSRQSLCDWAMGSAKWLGYLVDEMRKDVLLSKSLSPN